LRKGYLISMLFKGFCFFFFLVSKSFSCISLHVVLCYAHKSVSSRYITIEDLKESQINSLIVYMNRDIVKATKPLPCSMFWRSNFICIHPSPHHTLHISIFHNAQFPPIFLILAKEKDKEDIFLPPLIPLHSPNGQCCASWPYWLSWAT
jgi:hypothetical protein